MCLSPLYLPRLMRPVYGVKARLAERLAAPLYNVVSCGSCPECVSLKQEWLSQRAELMSESHYVFMQTLTVSNDWLLSVQVGDTFYPAFDITLFQNYIKRLRKYDLFHSPFKYIACIEYGGTRHRPHMHVLYFVPKDSEYWKRFDEYQFASARSIQLKKEADSLFWTLLNSWTVNVGSTRNPCYKKLCRFVSRFGRRNYDFHYVEPFQNDKGVSSCVRYVTKYLLKYDSYINKLRSSLASSYDPLVFRSRWNILKPRIFISKNFGVSVNVYNLKKIANSFELTLQGINEHDTRFYWYSPETGRKAPLSPYISLKYSDTRLYKGLHLIDGEIYQLSATVCRLALELYSKLSSYPRYDNDRDLDMYYKDLARRRSACNRRLLKIRDSSNFDFYELE